MRAYEIWERQGHTGDPEDRWGEAERALKAEDTTGTSEDRSEATVEEASPVDAVEAREAASDNYADTKRSWHSLAFN